ncbi:MAG: hypothetical protein IJ869_04915 [Clostridiales bacterium]|nr:hypothetical protein [Clostridiales bacterium]
MAELTIDDMKINIPDGYREIKPLPEDPEGSVPLVMQTDNALCFVLVHPTDMSGALPGDKKELIEGIRQFMSPDQGIVAAECGKDHVYSIVKTRKSPDGVQYILTFQKFIGDRIVNVRGCFEEQGITGMRDNLIFGMCRSQGLIGSEEDPMKGWASDPYDKDITAGFLMNLSEQEMFDDKFPGFPLTMCREFIRKIISS